MTHLSLFSGIGGLDLAAEWAGFTTVGQCEFADYPTRVLEKHWPGVSRWRDIRTLTKEDFYARTGLRTVDVISGGFPCQPFSVAGKQKGKGDDRYLWPEMLRVIEELRPRCVVGENVPGIIKIAAGQVAKDLERAGYHVVVCNFEAAAVGARHRRSRVFFVGCTDRDADCLQQGTDRRVSPRQNADTIGNCTNVAYTGSAGLQGREQPGAPGTAGHARKQAPCRPTGECCEAVCDSMCRGCTGDERRREFAESADGCGRAAESRLGEMAHGLSAGVDGMLNIWDSESNEQPVAAGVPNRKQRIKCLGNAVVPQQAYPVFRALREELERQDASGEEEQ